MLKLYWKLVKFLSAAIEKLLKEIAHVGSCLNFTTKSNSEYSCLFFYQGSFKLKEKKTKRFLFPLFIFVMFCVNVEMKMHTNTLDTVLTSEFPLPQFSAVLLQQGRQAC